MESSPATDDNAVPYIPRRPSPSPPPQSPQPPNIPHGRSTMPPSTQHKTPSSTMASTQDTASKEAAASVAGISQGLEATNLQSATGPIPIPQSLPTTVTRSYSIHSVETHTFCQVFADRIVVGLSQLPSKHVGNWTLCQAQKSEVLPKDIDFDVSILLGDHNDAMLELYARRLTDCVIQQRLIPGSDRMVILLGMSLQKRQKDAASQEGDREKFQLIVDTLTTLIKEALGIVMSKSP